MIELYDLTIPQHIKEHDSLGFFQCGIEKCSPGHSIGPKIRLYASIHFVLEGQGYLIINNRKHPIEAGQAFFFPANIETTYYADSDNPWKYCWIDFFGREKVFYTEKIFGKNAVIRSVSNIEQIYQTLTEYLKKYCETEIMNEIENGIHLYSVENTAQSLYANSVLYKVMAFLMEESPDDQKQSVVYVEQIKNYIDSYFLEIKEVNVVAERFHIHPNYLNEIFKDRYNISPKKYLIERKIDYASYLLAETDYTVQDISEKCGFESCSSFGRIYKK